MSSKSIRMSRRRFSLGLAMTPLAVTGAPLLSAQETSKQAGAADGYSYEPQQKL